MPICPEACSGWAPLTLEGSKVFQRGATDLGGSAPRHLFGDGKICTEYQEALPAGYTGYRNTPTTTSVKQNH